MADTSDNGRVTMAVLGNKLDTALAVLDELRKCWQADHDKVTELAGTAERNIERIEKLEGQQVARTWETRIAELILAGLTGLGLLKGA